MIKTKTIKDALVRVKIIDPPANTTYEKGEMVYLTQEEVEKFKDSIEIQQNLSYNLPYMNIK